MTTELWGDSEVYRYTTIFLFTLLSACAVQKPIITESAIDYNSVLEDVSNQQILLNILRAKDRMPMQFSHVKNITGSTSLESSLSLTLPFGGGSNDAYSLTPSAKASLSPSYEVVNLETEEYMRAVLSTIKESTFAYYIDRGWPRSILMAMFFRTIRIGDYEIRNSPNNEEDMLEFLEMIKYMRCRDFSFNSDTSSTKIGPLLSAETISESPDIIAKIYAEGLALKKNGDEYQVVKNSTVYSPQLNNDPAGCQEPNIIIDAIKRLNGSEAEDYDEKIILRFLNKTVESIVNDNDLTRSDLDSDLDNILCKDEDKDKKCLTIEYEMRSPQGMVYYLGELTRHYDDTKSSYFITIGDDDKVPLFLFYRDDSEDKKNLMNVTFKDSKYIIPDNNSGHRATQVISLVKQILAIHRSTKDLPTSNTVQLVGQ